MEHKDPHYLEDIAIHEGKEKSHGWDIDREFGDGTQERLVYVSALRLLSTQKAQNEWPETYAAYILTVLSASEHLTQDRRQAILMRLQGEVKKAMGVNVMNSAAVDFGMIRALGGEMDVLSQDRRRFITEIQNIIAIRLREEDFERAAENMSYLRLLGSTSVPSQEQRALVDDKLVQEIRENLSRNTSGGDNAAAERIAFLRLLRAYEVKFIPDKGIEIIDEAPAEFEQNKPQLPEVRRF